MGMIKWVLGPIILTAIIGGVVFFLASGLKDASLEKFEITGIKDLTTESFTVVGNLFVNNPSDLSIPLESIEYHVILKDTGESIGSGVIPPFSLLKSTTNKIPFEQQIRWAPTAKTASALLLKDKVLIEIKGTIRINLPKVKEYAIPFSQETDIKDYVKQFATSPVGDQPNVPANPITNPGNGANPGDNNPPSGGNPPNDNPDEPNEGILPGNILG